ncbi:unnamed protein product [Cylicocyclus nassatus]|uniref:Uncharacterized protein n=1 Tax=Cylicocyclus nassatus TaxID=53992 RepID=A0AA36H525_CYLNA|nr:unnamed protein product [Cylicocyclus nassatus]
MSAVEHEHQGYIWAHRPSYRNLRPYEYLSGEADTLCLLPSSMRVLCAVLCALLICSLSAAVFNSLHGNAQGSASYCKRPEEPFRPEVLCPQESMFFYYTCCASRTDAGKVVCCDQIRIWLLIAIVCVSASCILALFYSIYHYCCICDKESHIMNATAL